MTKSEILVAVVLGFAGCVGDPGDPPVHIPQSESSASDERAVSEAWCAPAGSISTHELVLRISLPNGRGPAAIVVPVVECSELKGDFKSSPSSCLSGDSFDPRAWVNGCVILRATTPSSALADIRLSWRTAEATDGECTESIAIALNHPIRAALKCGVFTGVCWSTMPSRRQASCRSCPMNSLPLSMTKVAGMP